MHISKKDLVWFCAIVLVVMFGNWKEAKSGAEDPAVCGTPETFKADANGDGRLDITDPVRVLRYLFRGEEAPVCFAQEGDPDLAAAFAALQADVEAMRAELASVQDSLPTAEGVAIELVANHFDSLPPGPEGPAARLCSGLESPTVDGGSTGIHCGKSFNQSFVNV